MLPASVTTQRHRSCILAWTVLARERSVSAMLGPYVVLKGHSVDEAFLPADLTLIDDIAT